MANPEEERARVVKRLRDAERAYADAESKLIRARREYHDIVTRWYDALMAGCAVERAP